MIFNQDVFYAKLHVLLTERDNTQIEIFLYDQLDILLNTVLIGQSIGSCG